MTTFLLHDWENYKCSFSKLSQSQWRYILSHIVNKLFLMAVNLMVNQTILDQDFLYFHHLCFTIIIYWCRWKEAWLERLNKSSEPWIHHWLSHQTRDPYWQYGSLSEDYTSITCPVFLIGGFSDLFKDAVFTMVQHLKCPVRALIGPWSHSWPTDSSPGPRIDHLKECLRWFDYQLKGLPTGVMDDPKLRLFLRNGMFPKCMYFKVLSL